MPSERSRRDRLPGVGESILGGRELIRRARPGDVADVNSRAAMALADVSRQLDASRDLPDFCGRMTRGIAALIPCARAAFWLLDVEAGLLRLQPEALGLPDCANLTVPCTDHGDGVAERIVHDDWTLLGPIATPAPDGLDPFVDLLQRVEARDAIVVAWHAGDRHLGALSCLDSEAPGGFTSRDAQLLRLIGLGAGLAWDRRLTEERVLLRRDKEVAGLRAEAERVASLEHVKSDFLNLASHELRAPVAVLRGYLSMIADGSFGELRNSKIEHLLPMLERKVEEIDRLVGDMLVTSRLEDERLYLRLEDLDLCGVVRDVVRGTDERRDGRHPVALLFRNCPVVVEGDPERIAMIVSNLLDNAIKYSPDGGDIDVECSADPGGGVACVVVSDNGVGIAATDLHRLFTRFGRIATPETADIPGTGLGLYLARELARLHGGDLTARSSAGMGSSFTLTLPLGRTT